MGRVEGRFQRLSVEEVAEILDLPRLQVLRLFRARILKVSSYYPFEILRFELDQALERGFQLCLPIINP